MPTSELSNIYPIVAKAARLQPKRILDLGIGFGKYGVLLREYLDVAEFRIRPEQWKLTIDGVEAFENYRTGVWDIYDEVHIEDFTKTYQTYKDYDLVLLIDSLEHIERPLGDTILDTLLTNNRNVIVSCPDGDYPQGAVNGNEFETHRARWTPEDFTIRGGTILHKQVCCVAHIAWKRGIR
jgi:hypothetical protein